MGITAATGIVTSRKSSRPSKWSSNVSKMTSHRSSFISPTFLSTLVLHHSDPCSLLLPCPASLLLIHDIWDKRHCTVLMSSSLSFCLLIIIFSCHLFVNAVFIHRCRYQSVGIYLFNVLLLVFLSDYLSLKIYWFFCLHQLSVCLLVSWYSSICLTFLLCLH